MFYWFKPLPKSTIDFEKWRPFIKNTWFRKNFMYFVYLLQLILVCLSFVFGAWSFSDLKMKIMLFVFTYIIHELLHIAVVHKIGDLSLTHSGIFLWMNSDAVMSKMRFWLFMTLPFIILTIVPTILCFVTDESISSILKYVAWINAIIAGADIINSLLIIVKPNGSKFYRGYYTE